MTIKNYDHTIEKMYHPENFEDVRVCEDCGDEVSKEATRCVPCSRVYVGKLQRGKNHWNYKEGRIKSVDGYFQVSIKGIKYYEHRLIMEELIGRKLKKNEQIHHKDGDRSNNDPENLELISTKEHLRLESEKRDRDKKGRFV